MTSPTHSLVRVLLLKHDAEELLSIAREAGVGLEEVTGMATDIGLEFIRQRGGRSVFVGLLKGDIQLSTDSLVTATS
ncbi:hypothetical protein HED60_23165 [Planctomycetales bacterium ZRK34]|nr:hypothetical protein HED60_23165 [Planctomycetales bacterium ZRK34]